MYLTIFTVFLFFFIFLYFSYDYRYTWHYDFCIINNSLNILFFRCFGPKCGGCGEAIHYQDFVRKARDKVYHLRCFTCSLCSKQLSTGEVLYLQPGDDSLVCKDDYLRTHQGRFIYFEV